MKNVKNLFGMAVMATALVGCSSNDNLNPNANDNGGKTGEAYASFKINLPTTSGTRAGEEGEPKPGTPSFDYGDAAEYVVKNGTILIFDANTDKFVESVELGTMNPWTDVKDNKGVTTSAIATVKLQDVNIKGSYKALVLLNNDVDDGTTKVTKVKLPKTTDTYASWSKETANVNADKYLSTDGFFMANAPMYTGTATEPTTLVKINNVCASREEAQAKAATVVYVERGLAKVTMQNFEPKYTIAAGETYAGDEVVIKNWQLDVTNNSTYPVHQTGGLKTSFDKIWETPRFYDGSNATFKRVYWGIDPNYDNADYQTLANCKTAFKMITNDQVEGVAGKPQYCLENTFNLANMKQGQTTRVVFKADFTPKNLNSSVKTFYKIGNNTAIWSQENLIKQIQAKAQKVLKEPDANKVKVTLNAPTNNLTEAGVRLVNVDNVSLVIDDEGTTRKLTPFEVSDLNTKLGLHEATTSDPKVGISTYYNGEAYYIARIKHFNELTHWEAGKDYFDSSSKPLNKEYLGRYGVLRNNWYELSVSKVSGLGYPEVPEVKPEVPDDENEKYINVEVKILDWAKRSQNIDL